MTAKQIGLVGKRTAPMRRTCREVAVQAIVFGALGFRASLEVTNHKRCAVLCSQLLPWLEQHKLDGSIDSFHREILATPYQELLQESQVEASWRGEEAAFLGWAINWFDRPHPTALIDAGELVSRLRILQPKMHDFVEGASFRPKSEIDDFCAFCLSVRHQFQVSVLDEEGQIVLERIHQTNLADLGLNERSHQQKEKTEYEAAQLTKATPSVRGLYVVRALASQWLRGTPTCREPS